MSGPPGLDQEPGVVAHVGGEEVLGAGMVVDPTSRGHAGAVAGIGLGVLGHQVQAGAEELEERGDGLDAPVRRR